MTRRRLIAGLCLLISIIIVREFWELNPLVVNLAGAEPDPSLKNMYWNVFLLTMMELVPVAIAFAVFFLLMVFTQSRWAVWCSLFVFGLAGWLFIGRELYNHFLILPEVYASSVNARMPTYDESLSMSHIIMHFLLPLGFILCAVELWATRKKRTPT